MMMMVMMMMIVSNLFVIFLEFQLSLKEWAVHMEGKSVVLLIQQLLVHWEHTSLRGKCTCN